MTSIQHKVVSAFLRVRKLRLGPDPAATERRDARRQTRRPAPHHPPASLLRTADVAISRDSGWPVYDVTPVRADAREASVHPARAHVMYLHGGSYVREIVSQHWALVAQLVAEAGAHVRVPIYALAPGSTAAETVPRTAALLTAFIDAHGSADVILMGDSAGAGLALAAVQQLRDEGRELPSRLVLISAFGDATLSDPAQPGIQKHDPMLDLRSIHECSLMYAGRLPLDDSRVSPLFGDFVGLPPLSLFAGTHDVIVPDSRRIVKKATDAGVLVEYVEQPHLLHDYPLMPTPEGKAARARIVALCRR